MSRVINTTDSISLIPSGYSSANSSYSSVSSSYPISNGYADSSSTTYAYITCTTGSRASSYISYTFSVTGIPTTATINSVTCLVKSRISSTSYISTAVAQLYSGSTAMGSSTDYRSTTASARTVNGGTAWTYLQLQNIQIRCTATRGTSNTSRSAYIYFYGADLTINYSVSGTAYTVTVSNNASGITVNPVSQELMSGETATITINGITDLSSISITDNGSNVTNSLEIDTSGTSGTSVSTNLGTYTLVSGSFNGSGATYFSGIVGNGVDATKTTSNYYSGGSGTIAVFTYNMAFTNIPSNAIITGVYCDVNGHAESTSESNEYMCVQLISGSIELSEEFNFKDVGSTSNSTQTIRATTLPTISQLANMKLQCRLGYYGGAINGATCYVTYTVSGQAAVYTYTISNLSADHTIVISSAQSEVLYLKINGSWVAASKVYQKGANNTWVEITNLDNLFSQYYTYILK